MKRTTVFLTEEAKAFVKHESECFGENESVIMRRAITWFAALTPYMRNEMHLLDSRNPHMAPDEYIKWLIRQDELRRNGSHDKDKVLTVVNKSYRILVRQFGEADDDITQ